MLTFISLIQFLLLINSSSENKNSLENHNLQSTTESTILPEKPPIYQIPIFYINNFKDGNNPNQLKALLRTRTSGKEPEKIILKLTIVGNVSSLYAISAMKSDKEKRGKVLLGSIPLSNKPFALDKPIDTLEISIENNNIDPFRNNHIDGSDGKTNLLDSLKRLVDDPKALYIILKPLSVKIDDKNYLSFEFGYQTNLSFVLSTFTSLGFANPRPPYTKY